MVIKPPSPEGGKRHIINMLLFQGKAIKKIPFGDGSI